MDYKKFNYVKISIFLLICNQVVANNTDFANYSPKELRNAVQHAIDNHPEVRAKWHSFIATGFSEDASRSGYRPRIDLSMGYNVHHMGYGPNRNWDGGYADLSLRQMIFDGFLTKSEVARFNNLQMVSYFELLDTTEKVAYEAFSAYIDMLRQHELVAIARSNLVRHNAVYEQIQKSSKAGISRSSDLEQVKGRLALAQSNLITEMTNLHDYAARYLRIIGSLPPENLEKFSFDVSPLPNTVKEALVLAYKGSPAYHAAIRNIMASESTVDSERSGYYPRVDLKATYGTQNYDGQGYREGQSRGSIGLEFTYNIYNGSKNRSAIRRALEDVNTAKDQRDLACINIRQMVQVSFNNSQKLSEQLPILNIHRTASEKVSVAYKKQFDIGQRSLLDVLDVEGEAYQASRAWINARYDLDNSRAKTLASMGNLVKSLDLIQDETEELAALNEHELYVDENAACPIYDINSSGSKLQDSDMDGITNPYDKCPNTPITDAVDKFGCSVFIDKEVTKRLDIQFQLESSIVDKKYYPEIQQLADFLKRYPNTQVEISGHSSLGGTDQRNNLLSKERAQSVAQILSGFFGIAPSRIKSEGYGTSQLIIKEKSPEADKINRRIEAKVTAIQQIQLKKD